MSRYGRFVPTSTITRRMDAKDARIQRETTARVLKMNREAEARGVVFRCAWCPPQPDAPVHVVLSHGVCPSCVERLEREL